MLYFTYPLNALLMMALPVLLWLGLWRRWAPLPAGERFAWRWVVIGALTFIGSQLVRTPLLTGLTALFQTGALPAIPEALRAAFNITVLSLTAGLFEEGARYLGYLTLARDARTWRAGVVTGAGHGGIEALVLGGLVAITFINMVALRDVDPASLPIPAEQQALLARQVAEFWANPWPLTLLGALERAFAIVTHLALSVLVLQAVVRRQRRWLLAAIAWHMLTNMVGVGVAQAAGPVWAEVALGGTVVVSLAMLFGLRPRPSAAASALAAEPTPAD